MDPVIEDQASLADIDDVTPGTLPGSTRLPGTQPWQEPEWVIPEEEGKVWAGGEVTGIAGGGMPEAASQADDPGTDTDISLPPVKERINLDRV
jgi:hypothetical protein